MKEIRWHARAGQGAKTAAQLLAVALLREGKSVQAFPEYGPERRGSPMRAYTRYDDRPVRRRDSVEEPDAVVVLEPSLAGRPDVVAGLRPDGLLARQLRAPDRRRRDHRGRPDRSRAVNLVMLGALAARLGEPPIERLCAAAAEVLGRKADLRCCRTRSRAATPPPRRIDAQPEALARARARRRRHPRPGRAAADRRVAYRPEARGGSRPRASTACSAGSTAPTPR